MTISQDIPSDLTKIKTKVALNLTKRQLICFSIAIILALPIFFISRKIIGMELSLILCMLEAVPFFLFGVYEKNGVPLERLILIKIRKEIIRPEVRRYRETNIYEEAKKKEEIRRKIESIERKEQKLRKSK